MTMLEGWPNLDDERRGWVWYAWDGEITRATVRWNGMGWYWDDADETFAREQVHDHPQGAIADALAWLKREDDQLAGKRRSLMVSWQRAFEDVSVELPPHTRARAALSDEGRTER